MATHVRVHTVCAVPLQAMIDTQIYTGACHYCQSSMWLYVDICAP